MWVQTWKPPEVATRGMGRGAQPAALRACWRRCGGAFSCGQGGQTWHTFQHRKLVMSINTCKAFAGSTCACTTVNRPPLPTASSSGDSSMISMQMSATSWCRQTPWQPGRRPRPARRSLVALAATSSSGSSSGSSSARPGAADLLTFAEVQEIARGRCAEEPAMHCEARGRADRCRCCRGRSAIVVLALSKVDGVADRAGFDHRASMMCL